MNIDIINVGHYRVTSHGGRLFDLFNRATDTVHSIKADAFRSIAATRTVESCEAVEKQLVDEK